MLQQPAQHGAGQVRHRRPAIHDFLDFRALSSGRSTALRWPSRVSIGRNTLR
jgi:hypothetical protein